MTSLLSAKKRAEEFAAVVDGGADESTLRPELMELVGVVGTLQREAQVGVGLTPRPEFTATLRERLMTEAATSLASDNILTLPVRKKGSRERRIALAASSLVLVGGTAGMAAAAQNALPGEALYPIKRGLENARAGLATSPADKGEDLLAQADSRLVEVQGLFDRSGNLSQVPGTIDDFTRQAVAASEVLFEEYDREGDDALIEELRTFAASNLAELQELSKSAAPEHQDELALAAEALMAIDSRARAVCPTCADEMDSLEMPTLFLAGNEARDAIEALGRVRVDNTHPFLTDDVPPGAAGGGQDKEPADGGGQSTDTDGTDATDGAGETDGAGGTDGETDRPGLELPDDLGANGPDSNGQSLPEVIDDLTGGDKGGTKGDKDGKDGGEVEDVLPEELEDAVDTLLP